MTALPQPCLLTIAEYLDGEAYSPVKHDYLGGTGHAMAGARTNISTRITPFRRSRVNVF